MQDDVIDVKAREIHQHRSLRMTPGSVFGQQYTSLAGSRGDWRRWAQGPGPRHMAKWAALFVVVVGGAFLARFLGL